MLVSLKVLSIGYAAGVMLAGLLASLAVGTRLGNDLLGLLTAMFNPLPAIALFRWRCSGLASAPSASSSC